MNQIPSDQPAGDNANQPFIDRVFSKEDVGPFGCLAVVATLVVLIGAALGLFSGSSKSSTPPSVTSTADQATPNEPEEIKTVSICDLTLKQVLVSASSYDPSWSWQFSKNKHVGEVLRKYDATNAFGVKLSAAYDCKYDALLDRVVFLQTIDSFGVHTLVGNVPKRGYKAHHHHRG